MKNGILLVLLASVMMFSCDSATDVSPELFQDEAVIQDQFPTQIELTDEERMILNEVGAFAKHDDVTFSRSKVFTFPDGQTAVGRSLLARYDGGIYALSLSVLTPDFIGHAISQWLFIFNAPENCSDNECGVDDLGNPDVRKVALGDAMVVLPVHSRRSIFDSWFFTRIEEGDVLEDARSAVVLLVLRTHGPAIAGWDLPSTPNEGCMTGEPNEGLCTNVQFTIHKTDVDRAEAQVFQPAGDFGGGVLEPGTIFPPTEGSQSTLRRGDDWVSYNLHTTGLPAGAYTNWWVIFNNPDACTDGCDVEDLFNPDSDGSVFWATGGVVQENGVGNFHAKIREGEVNNDPGQFVLGNPAGLVNAAGAEIHLIVKYHGLPSDDPDVLYGQTHTLLGSCEEGANANSDPVFGVQCFDPQFVTHKP